jgi:hypothetical protein
VKILHVTLISLALLATACSRRSDSDRKDRSDKTSEHQSEIANSPEREEKESQPSDDDIMEDCHAFTWMTKAMPARTTTSADCPQCPSNTEGTEVLKFQGAKVDRVSCAGGTCEVAVSIHASFNPSKGGTITGGLTGCIPVEQREQYSGGQTPPGEQVYHLNIATDKRESAGAWWITRSAGQRIRAAKFLSARKNRGLRGYRGWGKPKAHSGTS